MLLEDVFREQLLLLIALELCEEDLVILTEVNLVRLDRLTQIIGLRLSLLERMQVLEAVDRNGEDCSRRQQLLLMLHL